MDRRIVKVKDLLRLGWGSGGFLLLLSLLLLFLLLLLNLRCLLRNLQEVNGQLITRQANLQVDVLPTNENKA